MEFDLTAVFEELMAGFGSLTNPPDSVQGIISMLGANAILSVTLLCSLILMATWGYRLFRLTLPVTGAIAFAMIGTFVSHYVVEWVGSPIIADMILVDPLVVLVCALLGAIIFGALFKLGIFVVGAAAGWTVGINVLVALANNMPDVEFFYTEAAYYIFAIAGALILGFLCAFLFKPLFILITSIGSMAIAGIVVGSAVIIPPVSDEQSILTFVGVSAAVGAVAGIFCAVHQFKTSEH